MNYNDWLFMAYWAVALLVVSAWIVWDVKGILQ